MSRESDLHTVIGQATQALHSGRLFFVARLKLGMWGQPGHGEVEAWGETLQAIEAVGWVLDQWTVTSDGGGGLNAFPVFRRAAAASWPGGPQDRP